VNADPLDARIRDELLRWTKVGRKESRGLMRRRQAEAKLYFSREASSRA
jgi:GH24 family phage-related lysozyme (muramidase)